MAIAVLRPCGSSGYQKAARRGSLPNLTLNCGILETAIGAPSTIVSKPFRTGPALGLRLVAVRLFVVTLEHGGCDIGARGPVAACPASMVSYSAR